MKILLAVILVAGVANGADLYVPSQYTAIQAGINAATTGDTINGFTIKNGYVTGAYPSGCGGGIFLPKIKLVVY
jgi:hypothetical protein